MSESLIAILSVFVSVASLLVAWLAFKKSSKAQSEANSLQKKLIAIEQKREEDRLSELRQAKLVGRMQKREGKSPLFVVTNDGEVAARNIRVLFDDRPYKEHPYALNGSTISDLIGPGSESSCIVALTGQGPTKGKILILWDDEHGVNRKYETTIDFL